MRCPKCKTGKVEIIPSGVDRKPIRTCDNVYCDYEIFPDEKYRPLNSLDHPVKNKDHSIDDELGV